MEWDTPMLWLGLDIAFSRRTNKKYQFVQFTLDVAIFSFHWRGLQVQRMIYSFGGRRYGWVLLKSFDGFAGQTLD
jgi:hypothetical protein